MKVIIYRKIPANAPASSTLHFSIHNIHNWINAHFWDSALLKPTIGQQLRQLISSMKNPNLCS